MVIVVNAPMLSGKSQEEKRQENTVEGDECSPKMNFSQSLIHHPAKLFWKPESYGSKHPNDCNRKESIMKMGKYEI
ncbi:MAG: hypothetical protein CM1200mP30_21170 [Pseudomonadota bacterium]|nr:MAG: hypothetical protein CM1200mP30_21170 [Pseudomonadota bacterium]